MGNKNNVTILEKEEWDDLIKYQGIPMKKPYANLIFNRFRL